jgi:cob(I)alamin adenosyltransferase
VKIYTRTGDSGETALLGGKRVSKADARVAAYGDVDELNAWLGFVRAGAPGRELLTMLELIQRDLFAIGSRLADPGGRVANRVDKTAVTGEDVARLEGWIDQLETHVPALRRFILAGGAQAGASLHVARTVCRRAERHVGEQWNGSHGYSPFNYRSARSGRPIDGSASRAPPATGSNSIPGGRSGYPVDV